MNPINPINMPKYNAVSRHAYPDFLSMYHFKNLIPGHSKLSDDQLRSKYNFGQSWSKLVKLGQEMMLVTVSQVTNLKSFRYWSLDQFPVPVRVCYLTQHITLPDTPPYESSFQCRKMSMNIVVYIGIRRRCTIEKIR